MNVNTTTTTGTGKSIDTSIYEDSRTAPIYPSIVPNSCPHKLPCGHCRLLGYMCPYGGNYRITWKITC